MTSEVVNILKQQKRVEVRKQAVRNLNHSNAETGADDLRRNAKREKVELKRRERAKKVFRRA